MTLTYADEFIPYRSSLSKDHVQRYIKRLRAREDLPFKYYLVGEYGDLNQRPHYHAIVIGLGADCASLRDAWSFGFVHVDRICPETINYVTSYVNKKIYGKMAKKVYGVRLPPFALMSKGMGYDWLVVNKDHVLQNMGVRRKGRVVRAPRYYFKKMEGEIPVEVFNAVTVKKAELRDGLVEEERLRLAEIDRINRDQADSDLRWQQENKRRGIL